MMRLLVILYGKLTHTLFIYNSSVHNNDALFIASAGKLANQVSDRLLRHPRHIHLIGGDPHIAQPRRLVIVISHHGHILRYPESLLLQMLYQVGRRHVVVADKGRGQFFRKLPRKPFVRSAGLPIPVLQNPFPV